MVVSTVCGLNDGSRSVQLWEKLIKVVRLFGVLVLSLICCSWLILALVAVAEVLLKFLAAFGRALDFSCDLLFLELFIDLRSLLFWGAIMAWHVHHQRTLNGIAIYLFLLARFVRILGF